MKKYISIILILFSSVSFAQVSIKGEGISSKKINSSVYQIGDIKSSTLDLTQYQSMNGDCWRLMDGSSIQGSDLANFSSITNTPDARGSFLRMQNNGRNDEQQNPEEKALGSSQLDSFQGHHHGVGFNGYYGRLTQSPWWGGYSANVIEGHSNSSPSSPSSAGVIATGTFGTPRISNESRPKNITINYFIKINTNCYIN